MSVGGEAADLNVVQQGGASRAGLGWCGGERRCRLLRQPLPYPPVDDVAAIELATSTPPPHTHVPHTRSGVRCTLTAAPG